MELTEMVICVLAIVFAIAVEYRISGVFKRSALTVIYVVILATVCTVALLFVTLEGVMQ